MWHVAQQKDRADRSTQRILIVSLINQIFGKGSSEKCNDCKKTRWESAGERGEGRGGEGATERERDLSSMPLQPSFQIRTAPSPENVTFSRRRRERDGVQRRVGGRQMVMGGATAGLEKRRDGRIEGESEKRQYERSGKGGVRGAGFFLVVFGMDGEKDVRGRV